MANFHMGSPLPLSSLRLLVPPLRLMSAFMWQVAQQRSIKHYGKLQDFVTVVAQTIPELMTDRQRTLLVLGLRARITWDRFSAQHPISFQTFLQKIRSSQMAECSDADMKAPETNFNNLTQSLLTDPVERESFFQEVFPSAFSPDFDVALQALVGDFISRLEKLVPVPDFKQAASLLSADPSDLDDCLQSVSDSEDLTLLLRSHNDWRKLYTNVSSSADESAFPLHAVSDNGTDPLPDPCLNPIHLDTSAGVVRKSRDCQWKGSAARSQLNPTNSLPESSQKMVESGCLTSSSPAKTIKGSDTDIVAVVSPQELVGLTARFTECGPSHSSTLHTQGRVAHRCSHCGKCFVCPYQLVLHQQMHRGQTQFKCSQCGKSFKFSTSLSNHRRTHCVSAAYNCLKCGRDFGSLREKLRHQCSHDNPAQFNCPQSAKAIKTSQQLRDQRETCDQGPSYQCSHCLLSFYGSDELHSHHKTHQINQTLDCHKCGMSFNDLPSLVHHVEEHNRQALKPAPKPRRHTCTAEAAHAQTAHLCHQCGKGFSSSSGLNQHMVCHTDHRPFCCTYCGKCFSLKGNLTVHTRQHTGERPFVCHTCGKAFPSGGDLQVHQRFHTGDKPYQCKICDRSFFTSSHLHDHMRSHKGDRPHICNDCGRGFVRKQCLKEHLATHLGLKPFSCPHCKKTYTRRTHLNNHIKKSHPNTNYETF